MTARKSNKKRPQNVAKGGALIETRHPAYFRLDYDVPEDQWPRHVRVDYPSPANDGGPDNAA